ncbi:MAG: helix-turn-helix domain-containing protein [Halobacteriota archaeon]
MLSSTHDFCEDHGLAFDIESIRELDGEPAGRYGLTSDQYDALVTAFERGFFQVPREVTLEDLAGELDISHQALSERLRRGTDALVEDTLVIGST